MTAKIYLATLAALKRLLTSVGPQMLFKQRAVDVGFVAEAALHHVSRMNPHVHAKSSERRVAAPTRVTHMRPTKSHILLLLSPPME